MVAAMGASSARATVAATVEVVEARMRKEAATVEVVEARVRKEAEIAQATETEAVRKSAHCCQASK